MHIRLRSVVFSIFSIIFYLIHVANSDLKSYSYYPRDCQDVQLSGGFKTSGVYHVTPIGTTDGLDVYCDMTTDDGGWLVFQRRFNGSVDFYKNFNEYALGFGDPSGEFWLGNIFLHILTSQSYYRLRVDLEAWDGDVSYAEYRIFRVGDPLEKYRLLVAGYTGDAGDGLSGHNGLMFSTKDSDNDAYDAVNCGEVLQGGWWYYACSYANLNGLYQEELHSSNNFWYPWKEWSGLKRTEMKIKRL